MIETGIRFNDIHSFYDLNLILSSVEIPPATPKTTYIDVPGGEGSIDLTEAHGVINYNDRSGAKFTFTVHPSERMSFEQKKTQVARALNGKHFDSIIVEKDADYHYSGRCAVSEWQQNGRLWRIVVTATLSPYKYRNSKTVFVATLTNSPQSFTLFNGRKRVVPSIICSNSATLTVGGVEYNLRAGRYDDLYGACLYEGANSVKAYGSGTITFIYREGYL